MVFSLDITVILKFPMIYIVQYLLQSLPSNLKLICHISIIVQFCFRFDSFFVSAVVVCDLLCTFCSLLLRSFVFVSKSQYSMSRSNILQECLVYSITM